MSRSNRLDLGVATVEVEFHRHDWENKGWGFSPLNCWCSTAVADTRYDTRDDAIRAAIRWAQCACAEQRRRLRKFAAKFKQRRGA